MKARNVSEFICGSNQKYEEYFGLNRHQRPKSLEELEAMKDRLEQDFSAYIGALSPRDLDGLNPVIEKLNEFKKLLAFLNYLQDGGKGSYRSADDGRIVSDRVGGVIDFVRGAAAREAAAREVDKRRNSHF